MGPTHRRSGQPVRRGAQVLHATPCQLAQPYSARLRAAYTRRLVVCEAPDQTLRETVHRSAEQRDLARKQRRTQPDLPGSTRRLSSQEPQLSRAAQGDLQWLAGQIASESLALVTR